jgi:hypothetical protein
MSSAIDFSSSSMRPPISSTAQKRAQKVVSDAHHGVASDAPHALRVMMLSDMAWKRFCCAQNRVRRGRNGQWGGA